MCDIFDEIRADGRSEGLREGREETLLESVQNLVANLRMTADQALDALGVPQADRARYLAML